MSHDRFQIPEAWIGFLAVTTACVTSGGDA